MKRDDIAHELSGWEPANIEDTRCRTTRRSFRPSWSAWCWHSRFGAVAHRLKASPLVGYLLAGVVIGPFTPGFVADQAIANELAEIGIILLMFGVGLQFSLHELLSVRAIAVPGALVQIAVATALGAALALAARLVARAPAWSSASRCRSPAPWWCCAPCRSAACSTPSAAASRSAG